MSISIIIPSKIVVEILDINKSHELFYSYYDEKYLLVKTMKYCVELYINTI